MHLVGSWATEVEIQAAADCLGVNIFTFFNGRWLQYSCRDRTFSNQGLYVANTNGNHYETVVCVQQPQTHMCYGYCKVKSSFSDGYNLRWKNDDASATIHSLKLNTLLETEVTCRPAKEEAHVSENICCSKGKYSFSKYLKTQRTSTYKLKYHVLYKENQKVVRNRFYRENVLHREIKKAQIKRKYRSNILYKEKVKELSITKYKENVSHKEKVKELSKIKYEDVLHKEKKKDESKRKYRENASHKEKLKALSKIKYEDVSHKEKKKDESKRKYRENAAHKEKLKALNKRKYRLNQLHKNAKKVMSKSKYHSTAEHKKQVKELVNLKRHQIKVKMQEFDFVIEKFLDKVEEGPHYVCGCCNRLLFKHQVLKCKWDYYKKSRLLAEIAEKCISDEYLHKCKEDCIVPCPLLETA
ncbi:uncharacterized protein LOC121645684 [Melanotaenia boesemani]|uniref:uncharacterized protein LOC121645684 n=1 Tax=Melanotaenia boesemani TaxID=1250792 RepID=UPI001C04E07A|nr:uncharacterized protein LOC121645684 [Melanotaenia boesemani]